MIEPGLARISRLVQHRNFAWRAIHVAGTNGKGSVCAYTSAMLKAAGLRAGRFTSPHLIHRWDGIVIDEQPVAESVFRAVEEKLKRLDAFNAIGASEFELLTATAFEIFAQQDVTVAVVETGMGGRLDATNVLESPLVTILTKIALDHQAYLGSTLESIADHKAGIMKAGVPCVIDGTNDATVLTRLQQHSKQIGAGELAYTPNDETEIIWEQLQRQEYVPYQQTNLSCAFAAVRIALKQLGIPVTNSALLRAANQVLWAGRLQNITIEALTGRVEQVLLDGAHNQNAAVQLARYVTHSLRTPSSRPVTWVFAFSQGKDMRQILSTLLQPGDQVVAVQFGPVDGMPWVSAADSYEILEAVHAPQAIIQGPVRECGRDVAKALYDATILAAGDPMVICGSLYLVSDVLRLLQAPTI